ncbi:TRAF-type zinc finger domain-containing protein 1-like [Myxocyprinus asiaticus]|uniref:TRAF-type zinc finger domain-containing protein 1-like n=1 Tax=Myxocyprinus asiaticus TaxID=70543 RepID=UPI0022235DF4|nr:TRAF-type zinc finger domain-containing protein 1-like [Myxocyprinus asiaticus]
MEAQEVILCTHCNKEVAKANFDLHEPHCKRFLCLCPDCDESVPWEQLEEHKAQEHVQVKCGKCNKKMERRQLLDHETDDCSERLQICDFCQLELPLSSLMEHILSCGSRTERCSDCGRYVKLKEQLHHAQICGSTPPTLKNPSPADASDTDEESFKQCCKWLKYIPSEDLEEHEKVKGARNIERDLDRISTCPLCHLALLIKTLEWHEPELTELWRIQQTSLR